METGAITQYVDVAQLVLYAFWAFFAGLIYYLLRENHREGYPMAPGRENGPKTDGWPAVPKPKVYKLANGHEVLSPDLERADGDYNGQPAHGWIGAPLEPVGNPLLAGVGPGAWAKRADVPDMTFEGEVKIVPLRLADGHGVAIQDTDPRGLPVIGADGEQAGTVQDLWIDKSEMMFRYLEVEVTGNDRRVLVERTSFRGDVFVKFSAAMSTHLRSSIIINNDNVRGCELASPNSGCRQTGGEGGWPRLRWIRSSRITGL